MTSRAHRASTTHLPPLDDPPATVLNWLVERFPRVGEGTWRSRMSRGLVTRGDGTAIAASSPYEAHLQVRYFREVTDEPVVPFVERIVFQDEHLVIADKPPFLPVTPGGPFVRECLLGRLSMRLGASGLAPVHRLDRATSGLVVFSRRPNERAAYGELFAKRLVTKIYDAVAIDDEGPPRTQTETQKQTQWTVENRLVPGQPFFRMRIDSDPSAQPNSRTEIERVEPGRFRLRPITGKKHQLRVHMASLGFGILGDRIYPELLPEAPDDFAAPLRLVASELCFDDPVTGAKRHFVSGYDVLSLPSSDAPEAAPARTTKSVRSSS